jgi:hypothetical protein
MMKVVMILFMANFLVEQEEHITKSLKGFFGALFIVGFKHHNKCRYGNNDGSTKVGFRYRECARQTNNK